MKMSCTHKHTPRSGLKTSIVKRASESDGWSNPKQRSRICTISDDGVAFATTVVEIAVAFLTIENPKVKH